MSAPDSPSSTQDQTPPPLALLPPPTTTESADATAPVTASMNPRRLPPPCWSHEETVALIDAYRDKWHSLRRTNLKAPHWQEVADEVAAQCPNVSPKKTAVQCRHKMEKLRKRYRTEIQRARSVPVPSRFTSSWVHFKRMSDMEKGPDLDSDSPPDAYNDDEDEDDVHQHPDRDPYSGGNRYRNGGTNSKSAPRFTNRNSIPGNSGSSSGIRIRIPTGVSIARPGPRFQGKIDRKYTAKSSSNLNPNSVRTGLDYGGRDLRGSEEEFRSGIGGKRCREDDHDQDPISEIAGAVRLLGEGFVRTEQMKMEMMREIEMMRIEMEMKRSEMVLESQQRIVEAFVKAMADGKKK